MNVAAVPDYDVSLLTDNEELLLGPVASQVSAAGVNVTVLCTLEFGESARLTVVVDDSQGNTYITSSPDKG